MSGSVLESAREIPVLEEADVVVAGGGVAGCAAAYAAAKAGAKALLLERNGCLGGVATASLMANIGNMFVTATGEQVIHGFPGQLVDRLVAAGAASRHWKSRDIPGVTIDSERLKVILIDMLQEAGVTILTHALGARPILEGQTVRGVFVESKSGRQAVPALATIDATGEADLAWQAGAPMKPKFGGSASILFKLANVDIDAFVDFVGQDPEGFPAGRDWVKDLETFDRNWRQRGVLFFPHWGGRHWRFMKEIVAAGEYQQAVGDATGLDALGMYGVAGNGFLVVNSEFYAIKEMDIRSISSYELHAQKMCYYVAEMLKRKVPGFQNSVVAHIGVDLGIRTSRAIEGRCTLTEQALKDVPGPTLADDVIGITPAEDTHRQSGEFFKPHTTDVPFGVMVPQGCQGLLVASAKSISTEPRGLIRGMTGCMICGQAAGAAAALAARDRLNIADMPIRQVQKQLLQQGVYLGDSRRLAALGLA